MAWDDGDKGNPWRSDKDKGPADLDAIVRDLQRRLVALFRAAQRRREPRRRSGAEHASRHRAASWCSRPFGWPRACIASRKASEGSCCGSAHSKDSPSPASSGICRGRSSRSRRSISPRPNSVPYRANLLTRDENIVDVEIVVQFRRTDAKGFLFNVRDPKTMLTSVASSALREVVGRNTLDFVLQDGRTQVAHETQDLLQATLDSYGAGVTVSEVSVKDAGLPAAKWTTPCKKQRRRATRRSARSSKPRPTPTTSCRRRAARPKSGDKTPRHIASRPSRRPRARRTASSRSSRSITQAPAVTRERLYIETLEAVLASSTKVLVDTGSGNNVLYLPLDQLTAEAIRRAERRSAGRAAGAGHQHGRAARARRARRESRTGTPRMSMRVNILLVAVVIVAVLLRMSVFAVDEREHADRAAVPRRSSNASFEPGLHFKIPFADERRALHEDDSVYGAPRRQVADGGAQEPHRRLLDRVAHRRSRAVLPRGERRRRGRAAIQSLSDIVKDGLQAAIGQRTVQPTSCRPRRPIYSATR